MGEVEETAEVPFVPENMIENEEVVEFNTDATAMEVGLTPSKRGSKKAHHRRNPITEDKTILRLQERVNKHFHSSERTEDILKQIRRKLVQVEKLAVNYQKQNEASEKCSFNLMTF